MVKNMKDMFGTVILYIRKMGNGIIHTGLYMMSGIGVGTKLGILYGSNI